MNTPITWLSPWHPVDDAATREALERQLRVEVGPRHVIHGLNVRLIARPVIADLASQVQEVVHLAVMDGDQVVILDRVDVPSASATPSLPGRLFPAHSTSLGKAMLAGLEDWVV